ncbi:MAG: DUF4870 domain-containing protein [Brumimicrobium sp.]|nr:DUF4870 domain-containing protein [Brumimicrobium sp.]
MTNLDTATNEKVGPNVDKTVGIVAYVTLIGFIIALVLNSSKTGEEKKFGAFHLRQMLGLIIFSIGLYIAVTILLFIIAFASPSLALTFGLLLNLVFIGILVLVVIGIINAANGEYKEVPLIGQYSSKILGNTFE